MTAIIRFLSAFIFLLPFIGCQDEPPTQRPNIIFIMSDDHAYQASSAYQSASTYGLNLNQTPNIDRIAREGMRFDQCLVTNSICGPCRAEIQTGKYSHLNGFFCNGNKFDGTQQTFPKLLQKAGYTTAIYGKSHLKGKPQGYDDWKVLPGQGLYYNPDLITPEGRKRINGHCTDIVTNLAIDWLKTRRDGKCRCG